MEPAPSRLRTGTEPVLSRLLAGFELNPALTVLFPGILWGVLPPESQIPPPRNCQNHKKIQKYIQNTHRNRNVFSPRTWSLEVTLRLQAGYEQAPRRLRAGSGSETARSRLGDGSVTVLNLCAGVGSGSLWSLLGTGLEPARNRLEVGWEPAGSRLGAGKEPDSATSARSLYGTGIGLLLPRRQLSVGSESEPAESRLGVSWEPAGSRIRPPMLRAYGTGIGLLIPRR